ncbi:MAG: hypothetical protein HRU10_01510 [Opitutales bacterium]|nr:hypothetical protein [Opitutales bacterium]
MTKHPLYVAKSALVSNQVPTSLGTKHTTTLAKHPYLISTIRDSGCKS